ncbi:MAG TPA: SDR family oxidoreductase [Acidobacteriaceae bacterium]|jgi:3-oxoacyl-[acyl-carrier protein] reductase|nr:SDR family oxidoreductase [Acidobacteriaceae bacterium]
MDTGLRGRVALVTGASQGIGRSIAESFAAEGAHVVIGARNVPALQELAADIEQRYKVRALAHAIDVAIPEQVDAFVQAAQAAFGKIDICVTNAGGPPAKSFMNTTDAEWQSAFVLNLQSVVRLARAVLPAMQRQHWGRIVTLTSISVKQPVPDLILSNSIRTGVTGLVRSLANEFGKDGITVNNVGPGFTATDRLQKLAATRGAAAGVAPEEIMHGYAAQVPLGRVAEPREIADAVVWLASERASFITGQTLLVDGGAYRGL